MRSAVLTAMIMKVLWGVTPCILVDRYQRIGETSFISVDSALKFKAAGNSETLVTI
jgi:hypothetical protein